MALIRCIECGKELSDKAINCPHCGYINRKVSSNKKAILIIIAFISIVLVSILVLSIIFSDSVVMKTTKSINRVQYNKSSTPNISYEDYDYNYYAAFYDRSDYHIINAEEFENYCKDIIGEKIITVGSLEDYDEDERMLKISLLEGTRTIDVYLSDESEADMSKLVNLINTDRETSNLFAIAGIINEDKSFFSSSINITDAYILAVCGRARNYATSGTTWEKLIAMKEKDKEEK